MPEKEENQSDEGPADAEDSDDEASTKIHIDDDYLTKMGMAPLLKGWSKRHLEGILTYSRYRDEIKAVIKDLPAESNNASAQEDVRPMTAGGPRSTRK